MSVGSTVYVLTYCNIKLTCEESWGNADALAVPVWLLQLFHCLVALHYAMKSQFLHSVFLQTPLKTSYRHDIIFDQSNSECKSCETINDRWVSRTTIIWLGLAIKHNKPNGWQSNSIKHLITELKRCSLNTIELD